MATLRTMILNGPSKMDLMMCLFRKDQNRNWVIFSCNMGDITVVIEGLEREDGSGESWCFKGYVFNPNKNIYGDRVQGCYSTERRKGTLSISSRIIKVS